MFKLESKDPGIKFIFCLFFIFIGLVSGNVFFNSLILVAILFMEFASEKSLKAFKPILILVLIVAMQVLIINLLFGRNGEMIYSLGILKIYDGFLATTIAGTLKISIISFSAFQFGKHTDSMEMAKTLTKWNVPYRFAMLVPMVSRFFPVMVNEYHSICNSQSARGVPCDTIPEKIRNLPASIMPLIYRALRISGDAALSAELRGYGRYETRTFKEKRKVFDTVVDYGEQ